MDETLHEKAKVHAAKVHFTDFSGLLTKLIVDDIRLTESAAAAKAGQSAPGKGQKSRRRP